MDEILNELLEMKGLYSGKDKVAFDKRIDKLINSISEGDTNPETKEGANSIADLWEEIHGSGFTNKTKEAERIQDISGKLSTITGLIQGFSDRKEAKKQIKEAESALQNISTPANPRAFKRSNSLQDQIRSVREGSTASGLANRTAGLSADIDQTYRANLENAKVASGGQAGAFGSYAQAAARNKLKNALSLQDQKNRLAMSDRSSLANLTAQEIQENRYSDINARNLAEYQYRDYTNKQNAAGGLLRAGRINKRFARAELLDSVNSLSPYIDQLGTSFQNRGKNSNRKLPQDLSRGKRGSLDSQYGWQQNSIEPLYDFSNADSLMDFNNKLNNYGTYYS